MIRAFFPLRLNASFILVIDGIIGKRAQPGIAFADDRKGHIRRADAAGSAVQFDVGPFGPASDRAIGFKRRGAVYRFQVDARRAADHGKIDKAFYAVFSCLRRLARFGLHVHGVVDRNELDRVHMVKADDGSF